MNDRVAVPIWFWVAGAVLLIWNATGIFFFYTQMHMTYDQMVATMGKPAADCFAMMPAWQWWAYGIAVWGGALGSIALLLRRVWALPLYLAALIAVVVQYGYSFGVLHIQNTLGWSAAGFPAFIIIVAALSLWFASTAKKKGWIA